jgi:hypothetical protein
MKHRLIVAGLALAVLAACQPETKTEAPASPEPPKAAEVQPAAPAEPAEAPAASTIKVDLTGAKPPAITDKLASPLVIEGTAPSSWIFEAQFPVTLAVDGEVIAEVPARSQDDWTSGAPTHPYRARVEFMVTKETKATLTFAQDMPGQDDKGNDLPPKTVKVPVTLVPAK